MTQSIIHKASAAVPGLNAVVDQLDSAASAIIRIYANSGNIPTSCEAPASGTMLASLVMSDPAFGSASSVTSGAQVAAAAITTNSSAEATGSATYYRASKSDGSAIMQGDVGTSGSNMTLNTVSIQQGAEVQITSFLVTFPHN